METKIKASDLEHLLATKFSAPEWIFLPQVRSTTGFMSQIRTADGIAINTFPSRGFEINGFEIKVSRSDWLTELKNGAKAEEIFQYCDKFWLVVADKDIVQNGELPKGWGLLYPGNGGLRIGVKPDLNKKTKFSMGFVCALLRRSSEGMVAASTIKQQLADEFTRGQKSQGYAIERMQNEREEFEQQIREFEKAAGVNIGKWSGDGTPEQVGKALRRVLLGEKFDIKYNLDNAESSLNHALEEIKKTRKATE